MNDNALTIGIQTVDSRRRIIEAMSRLRRIEPRYPQAENPKRVNLSSQGELGERSLGHEVCDKNGENFMLFAV